MIDRERLKELAAYYRSDPFALEMLQDAMTAFRHYHRAVYDLEVYRELYAGGGEDTQVYQSKVTEMDRSRTICHNGVIAQVAILNRMAQKAGLPLFYGGTVSEERPHRRILANAVFELMETIIKERA